jgi:aryl-alcohol dehydrogenase-like predicted oxidoreductase
MKQRQLGAGGPMVGEIGFGAMSFGGIWGATDEVTSHRTLDACLEQGVTHLDTALIYGPHTSEIVIGNYLKKNPSAGKRFSIATKGGISPEPRGTFNNEPFLRQCLEGSLQRLGVDHVDLYYVHRREHAIPIEDVMQTMAKFVKEGKIGGIGLSEVSPASLERAVKVHPVRAVQNEYSLWTRLPELGMVQACQRYGAALVAFSPVGRGVFGEADFDLARLPGNDWRKSIPRFIEPDFSFNMERIRAFKSYAKSRGWTTASLALAWLLHRGDHIIPIPGTRTPEHLADDAAGSAISLSASDMAAIEGILPAGFAHGNRYSLEQQGSAEQYC